NLQPQNRFQKVRIALLLGALATVVIGWPLEHYINELREPRYEAVDRFLQNHNPKVDAEVRDDALEARGEFGRWHGISLLVNFATLALVAGAMALAAQLPAAQPRSEAKTTPGGNGEQKTDASLPVATGS